jgi:hypothetical protein
MTEFDSTRKQLVQKRGNSIAAVTLPARYNAPGVSPIHVRTLEVRPAMTTSVQAHHGHDVDGTVRFIQDVRQRIAKVVVGQDVVVERLLIALFTGGHLLLQGVPGLAKTLLVATLSKTIDLSFARIQFTIDLLPSDILGSEILDQRTMEFRTNKGPIFTNLLLADAGTSRYDRQGDVQAARSVPRHRDAEPSRAERDIRVARSTARSLHVVSPPRLPDR